ncbi:MAG: hypothetical protein JXB08_00895 [Bacilli bacterium]|nr:hypothetical protein [Bacilli bacterium]MBN2877705.1 hypothetical protein [Bacilli bacterium]
MKKKLVIDLFLIIGLIGMLFISILTLIDNEAPNIIAIIPTQIALATLFIVGYLGYLDYHKKEN